MTIAELFVNLGVTGKAESARAISDIKGGLKEVANTGLAAKAGILAAVYGLERLTGMAAKEGMELQKFGIATGLSTKKLQQWQFAAKQMGVEGEHVVGSVRSIQNAMTDMLLGKGAPEGLAIISNTVGFDPEKARDTFYVMGQLEKFAKTVPPDIAGNVLKSFGISEEMFQFFRANKLNIDKIKPSNLFSDREIRQLARVNVGWVNLWHSLKIFGGRIVAEFGESGVGALSGAFDWIKDAAHDLRGLMRDVPEFKVAMIAAGVAIAAAFAPITTAIVGITLALSDLQKRAKGEDSWIKKNINNPIDKAIDWWFDESTETDVFDGQMKQKWRQFMGKGRKTTNPLGTHEKWGGGLVPDSLKRKAERIAPSSTKDKGATNNYNFKQQLLFNGEADPKQVAGLTNRAVKDAYRQVSAQGREA